MSTETYISLKRKGKKSIVLVRPSVLIGILTSWDRSVEDLKEGGREKGDLAQLMRTCTLSASMYGTNAKFPPFSVLFSHQKVD